MRPGVTMPCWWGAPGSTCAPSWTISASPAATPRSGRPWSPSWARAGPRCPSSTPGWPSSTRWRRPGWSLPTSAGWCGRSRSRSGPGQPFSTFGPGLEAYPLSAVTMVGLAVPTEEVDRRIAERFGRWMEEGLLDEVRALAARPGGISRTARQALGYRELLAHVEAGCAPGCLHGGSRAPDPVLRPPPGVVVPARPPDQCGPKEGRTPPICSTGPWRRTHRGRELRDWRGARQQTRRGGERLHRRARSRRHPPAFGGPGAPALRSAAGYRGRRDHPGRTWPPGL